MHYERRHEAGLNGGLRRVQRHAWSSLPNPIHDAHTPLWMLPDVGTAGPRIARELNLERFSICCMFTEIPAVIFLRKRMKRWHRANLV